MATISGADTQLNGAEGIAVDAAGHLWVANSFGPSIVEFAAGANGDATPIAAISGADTLLDSPGSVALNTAGDLLVGESSGTLLRFAPGDSGDTAPVAVVNGGAGTTGLFGVGINVAQRLFAASFSASTVSEFAAGATGAASPANTLGGPHTGLKFAAALALARAYAVTHAATGLTANAATLHGVDNPQGLDAHYYFQYGTSTAYGQTTPRVDAGAGTTRSPAAASVSGLTSATTYHFRIVVDTDAGRSFGLDSTFTTS